MSRRSVRLGCALRSSQSCKRCHVPERCPRDNWAKCSPWIAQASLERSQSSVGRAGSLRAVVKTGENAGYVWPSPEKCNSGGLCRSGRKFNRACAVRWGSRVGIAFCNSIIKLQAWSRLKETRYEELWQAHYWDHRRLVHLCFVRFGPAFVQE